ncbi:unnamed protein product, partial [Rangifer tarandus platyrhynchus]
ERAGFEESGLSRQCYSFESDLAFSCVSGPSSQRTGRFLKEPRPLSGQFSAGHAPSLATLKGAASSSL